MKPILFLDFDGIINSENLEDNLEELFLDDRFTGESYCKELADNLSKFVKENDFNIVISSTWRKFFSFFELQQILSIFKIDADRLLDITPDIGQERYKDIELWIDTNNELKEHQYSFFFILDDNSDAWTDDKNFYQVDVKTGFTEHHRKSANKLISELRSKSGKFVDATYIINSVSELLELQKKLFEQGYCWNGVGRSYMNVNYVKLHTNENGYIYWNEDKAREICLMENL